MRHQTGDVIHPARVNAIRSSRLCVKPQGFTGDDPDDFLGTGNPLPENMLSMSDFRNRQAIVLAATALCGSDISIPSSWVKAGHFNKRYTWKNRRANCSWFQARRLFGVKFPVTLKYPAQPPPCIGACALPANYVRSFPDLRSETETRF